MTAPRRFGEDTPFGVWLRAEKRLDSHQYHFLATDADWIFRNYRPVVSDAIGDRELYLMMMVEVKTRGAEPHGAQLETLFIQHQISNRARKCARPGNKKPLMVWSAGAFVLSLSGVAPQDGAGMRWGVFAHNGSLSWFSVQSIDHLVEILSFRVKPTNPTRKLRWDRHHKTREVVVSEQLPLGFSCERRFLKKS